jgi:hypothetical protein
VPHQDELPVLALPADVREAQEVEGLRLPEPLHRPARRGEAAELDQAGLLGMQVQPKRRQPAKIV